MSILVTDVIDQIQELIPSATDAWALKHLNNTWGDFLQRAKASQAAESINVTQSTSQVILTDLQRVESAVYRTSSTSEIQLTPRSIEEWDLRDDAWRQNINLTTGTPSEFALEQVTSGGVIKTALYMRVAPDTTTSGGYPILVLSGSKYSDFTTASTHTLPHWVTDPGFLVQGACWRIAQGRGSPRVAEFLPLYEKLRDEQLRSFANINGKLRDTIDFSWYSGDLSS